MRKNKAGKMIFNGVLLAAMAALGLTVYQVGTSGKKDSAQEVLPLESTNETQTAKAEEEPLVDAGTSQVEADMSSMDGDDFLANKDTGDFVSENSTIDDSIDSAAGTNNLDGTNNTVDMAAAADTAVSVYTAPEINFSEDTLMEWPLHGTILIDYSMDQTTYFPTLDQYKLNPSIVVQAGEGAPVVSAVNGTVFSIEEDAQTGTTVTMELGNGYQAIYGQLTDLNISEGDTVTKGTTIGYVAAPTKYYSKEGSNLYFAMKKDGKPIDPIAYLP
ncbi:MAG: M23 family metallopeptidase [Blautia sp.]|nr:M23 family metallopeptidase [Blautia sp.]MDD7729989.1 M23 family metallopeptidase [Clostridia bacterium]